MVVSSIETKTPKRSRIETRSIEPKEMERIRLKYSGASPVRLTQRVAARIVKNAERATTSLKYIAKSSTTYPSPKKLPSNRIARSTAVTAKAAREPKAASPVVSPKARGLKTPTMRTMTEKTKATISGKSATKVPAVVPTSYLLLWPRPTRRWVAERL